MLAQLAVSLAVLDSYGASCLILGSLTSKFMHTLLLIAGLLKPYILGNKGWLETWILDPNGNIHVLRRWTFCVASITLYSSVWLKQKRSESFLNSLFLFWPLLII